MNNKDNYFKFDNIFVLTWKKFIENNFSIGLLWDLFDKTEYKIKFKLDNI